MCHGFLAKFYWHKKMATRLIEISNLPIKTAKGHLNNNQYKRKCGRFVCHLYL